MILIVSCSTKNNKILGSSLFWVFFYWLDFIYLWLVLHRIYKLNSNINSDILTDQHKKWMSPSCTTTCLNSQFLLELEFWFSNIKKSQSDILAKLRNIIITICQIFWDEAW